MLASFRSALLTYAALTATFIVPAHAGPTAEAPLSVASASFPQVAIPDLLDPQGEPERSQPDSDDSQVQQVQPVEEAAPATELAIDRTEDLAAMVADLRGPEPGSRELECLATGVYFEAKSEPLAGQLAVGKVIANRAASGGRFPPTYCGVLFQPGQFSFVHGGRLPTVPRANKQWQTAVAIAKIVDQGLQQSSIGNA